MNNNLISLNGLNGNYTFDPFDQTSLLGKGGTGNVFKGENVNTKEKVAIKVLFNSLTQDPGILKRLEVESSLKFEHPNIIKVLDFVHNKTTNIYHLITEFLDGETLDKVISRNQTSGITMPLSEVNRIGLSVARALEVLHNNSPQIIHRDVKPSNIIICKNGDVKLMDLGIAKVVEVNDTTKQITSVGAIIGTYHYLSPEQIQNGSGVNLAPSSDLYSLGITMYECLTNKPPFDGNTEYELFQQHLNEKLPSNNAINKKMYIFLLNATAKKSEHRYASASAFMNDLEKVDNSILKISLIYDKKRIIKKATLIGVALLFIISIGFTTWKKINENKINALCGSTEKSLTLSPRNVDSIKKLLLPFKIAVEDEQQKLDQWNQWFSNPDSFNGSVSNISSIIPNAKNSKKKRLLLKLLLETPEEFYISRLDYINGFDWNNSPLINEILTTNNYKIKTSLLNQLDESIKQDQNNLFLLVKSNEESLYNTQNYKLLFEYYFFVKNKYNPECDLKISRYALLNGYFSIAQSYALNVANDPIFKNQANLLLANALACQNNYNDSYNKLISVISQHINTSDFQNVGIKSIADLDEIQYRNDGNFKVLDSDFLRFFMGVYYYYFSDFNASYKDKYINKFNCFLASSPNNSLMEPFRLFAKEKIK